MRRRFTTLSSCLIAASAASAHAGGPTNDVCTGALVVPGNAITFNPALLNTTTADTEFCSALESCENGGVGTSRSVWYSYTPADGFTGTVVIDTRGSTYDTVLSVFDGCAVFNPAILNCFQPTELACNDNAPLTTASEVALAVVAGETYIIKVAAYGPDAPGGLLDFNLRWLPANDLCTNATLITTAVYDPPQINTVHADIDLCEALESCEFNNVGASNSVWYEFIPPANGTVTIDTNGSSYDTILSIFDDCGRFVAIDTPCDLPAELACDDDSGDGLDSLITDFPVMGCQRYIIKVSDYNTTPGGGWLDFNLVFTETCPEDIDQSGTVDVVDLLAVLAKWGGCQ